MSPSRTTSSPPDPPPSPRPDFLLRLGLSLIRGASRLLPVGQRVSFRREWEAELRHGWLARAGDGSMPGTRDRLRLLRRALGALMDAAVIRSRGTLELGLLQDLRYGARMARRNPAFTAVAVLTLALGIGANTAIFSVVHGVLLRPLPFADAEELVLVWEHNRPRNRLRNVVGPANFIRWQERQSSFESMASVARLNLNLTGDGEPQRLDVALVSPSLFPMLGVAAATGRSFRDGDAKPETYDTALISHELWQRRYGGDPGVVGSSVTLDGLPATVVGVLPPGFALLPGTTDVYLPQIFDERARSFGGRYLVVLARLRRGVSLEEAQAEMSLIGRQLEEETPERNAGWGVNLVPLREQLVGDVRTALLVLLAAVGGVLLVACANVAGLQLSRAAGRSRELSLRLALGAGRLRLVRQLLAETTVLSLLGAAAGLLAAYWGLRGLLRLLPADIPSFIHIGLSQPALLFTLGATLASTLLVGLAPALHTGRHSLRETVRGDAGSGGTIATPRLRSALTVAEIAVSLVLLIGTGLLVRSLSHLLQVDPGFSPASVHTLAVTLPRSSYGEPEQQVAFFDRAIERITALPMVEAAGAVSFLPLRMGAATSIRLPDRPVPAAGDEPVANVRAVAGDYFLALGIPLLEGRTFRSTDGGEGTVAVVVSEGFARTHWPEEESALGRRVVMNWGGELAAEIVGVVGDVRHEGLDADARPTLYWPTSELPYGSMSIVIRAARPADEIVPAARHELATLDPDLPLQDAGTMEQVVAEAVDQPRSAVLLLGLFSGIALALALVGVYGLLSLAAASQAHDIGIRMALGAGSAEILGMVLRQGAALLGLGLALGWLGALGLTRFLASLLFEVAPTDLPTYVGVSALLVAVGLGAAFLPAWRASRADPATTLRHE